MEINLGEHGVIIGKTGSGKSQQLLHLAKNSPHPVIIFDTKIDDDFIHLASEKQKLVLANGYKQAANSLKRGKFDYLIIRPADFELNNPQALDNYLMLVYQFKNLLIFIDEVYQFHTASGRAGNGLITLMTRGRSRGLSLFCCTQRPVWLSKFILSESTHYFIYKLMQAGDKKIVKDFLGADVSDLPQFHYYYFNSKTHERPQHEQPVKIFKRIVKRKSFF